MAGFAGFSEDEIKRFKAQGQADVAADEPCKRETVKKATLSNGIKRTRPREKVRSVKQAKKVDTVANTTTSPSAGQNAKHAEKTVQEEVKERQVEVIMEPEKIKEIELSNLEKMQQKQKEMEKVNKQKEKMLQYTLKERYRKTKRETETLKLVQKELSHLDNILHSDIEVLREKIDKACLEYEAARKRFERAENEYVDAKVNLHNSSEMKDQLTEHLCSIIQENEQRKAKKLAELMSKLEIGDQDLSNLEELSENIIGNTDTTPKVTPEVTPEVTNDECRNQPSGDLKSSQTASENPPTVTLSQIDGNSPQHPNTTPTPDHCPTQTSAPVTDGTKVISDRNANSQIQEQCS